MQRYCVGVCEAEKRKETVRLVAIKDKKEKREW
jgi:hypothetical protein